MIRLANNLGKKKKNKTNSKGGKNNIKKTQWIFLLLKFHAVWGKYFELPSVYD